MQIDARPLRSGPGESAAFRLLGTRVRVRGPAAFVDACRLVFARFTDASGRLAPDLAFEARPDGDGFRLAVEHEGRSDELHLASEEQLFGHAYARILDQATRRAPDTLAVHAAALAHAGQGVILAAPSGHGKSTLTLALAARGFTVFSDEVAPIDRKTRALSPFPMAVGCRPGTHALLSGTTFAAHGFKPQRFAGKMLYDPCTAGAPPLEPVPLSAVLFVEAPSEADRVRRRFRLQLDPPAPAIAADLAALDAVRSARTEDGGSAVIVELCPGTWAAPAVEACLDRARVLVSGVEDLDAPRPDFAAEPRLERLGTTEGVLATLRHLRGFGALEDLVRATQDGFGGLLVGLAKELRGSSFWRLTPGRLPALVEAVESVL